MRKLVVLDVDGVVFKGQFLLSLSRHFSRLALCLGAWDGVMFNLGRRTLEGTLSQAYKRVRGISMDTIWDIYRAMPLARNCREAVQELKRRGHRVVLLTAGVPDFLVKDLAERLGADYGEGMSLEVAEGRLTGGVGGALSRADGKEKVLSRMMEQDGWKWRQVVVVGDDLNNLPIMKKAGVSIAFRATHSVRVRADHVMDADDLMAIVPLVEQRDGEAGDDYPVALTPPLAVKPWRQELRRKVVHALALAVPLSGWAGHGLVTGLFGVLVGLFLVAEWFRVNGAMFPIFGRIMRYVIRERERRCVAIGPLTLVLGVIVSLWCFHPSVAYACVSICALGDAVATIVGERWGRVPLPHNGRKTLEGSAMFLVTGLVCGALYMPFQLAIVAAFAGALIESLPIQDWDNFCVPVGAGCAVTIAVRHFGLFPGIGY